jgi:hypothetical protein
MIARRFGSAMISNADFTLLIYLDEHMLVKVYTRMPSSRCRSPARGCVLERGRKLWLWEVYLGAVVVHRTTAHLAPGVQASIA